MADGSPPFPPESGRDPLPEDHELLTAEAEHGLLGSLMRENRLYEQVAHLVSPEHFSYAAHGRLYEQLAKLIEGQTPANPITLRRFAEDDETLKSVGGGRYLARLVVSIPTLLNARHYAQQIVDAACRRAFAAQLRTSLNDTLTARDKTFDEIAEDHERQLVLMRFDRFEERPVLSASAAIDLALDAAEQVYKADGRLMGVTTGLIDLDRRLGGLHRTDLVVIAARPGMGKSALASTIAEAAARDGKRVYFASLEMSADQIAARQLAGRTGISAERQRAGPLTRSQINSLIMAGDELRSLPLYIDDMVLNSISTLRQRLKRHRRRYGLDLLIVDYLQLMMAERAENRVQEVSALTRGLKAIAKELEVPILALSQLSRAVEAREDKRPMLADLRESGSIEQDADVVLFVYRDEYYKAQEEPRQRSGEAGDKFEDRLGRWRDEMSNVRGKADFLIRKNRHGRLRDVKVAFDGERTLFSNLAYSDSS